MVMKIKGSILSLLLANLKFDIVPEVLSPIRLKTGIIKVVMKINIKTYNITLPDIG